VIDSKSALSAPAGCRFPREVIAVAVRWYCITASPTATWSSCGRCADWRRSAHDRGRARLMQNLRRGHYELTVDVPAYDQVLVAFTALAPFL
jgi:hypothetical protein